MRRRSRRLYLQIYLAFVGIVVLFALLVSALFWLAREQAFDSGWHDELAADAARALPAATLGRDALRAALERLAGRHEVSLLLLDASGRPLARAGRPVAPPRGGSPARPPAAGMHPVRGGMQLSLPLADGRLLVAQRRFRPGAWWPWALLALVVAIGIGAHPLARRITSRLERLQAGVENLGAGNLGARVVAEGDDEVAALAASFNRTAERIERLVTAERAMLANASHELRSPLARLRMAVELLGDTAPPRLAGDLRRDIAELDTLVDEILTMSRIEASAGLARREPLDLGALAAEEAARAGADSHVASAPMQGDPVWLRRLVRNLLDNARRHAGAAAVRVQVAARQDGWLLVVEDDGPGVAEPERERIFEPFYRPAGRAEGQGGGVGLGLALVRQIARRHGGDARCTAAASGGSRFEVRLAAEPPG